MSAVSGPGGGTHVSCGSEGSSNNSSPLSPEDEKKCKAVAAAAASALQGALGICPSCGQPNKKCPFQNPRSGIKPKDKAAWDRQSAGLQKEWEDAIKQQTQNSSSRTSGSDS